MGNDSIVLALGWVSTYLLILILFSTFGFVFSNLNDTWPHVLQMSFASVDAAENMITSAHVLYMAD